MSKKDEIIAELKREISDLKLRLDVTKNVDSKFRTIYEQNLASNRENPILNLPSGNKIAFSSLNQEQLEYLESLALKTYKH